MTRRTLAGFAGIVLSLTVVPAGARALTRAEVVRRAQYWVDAALPYCQCPNFGYDRNGYCGGRQSNPAWDPYRSDCSGLVSWSWGLPPPGRVTWTFAPYNNDVSYEIPIDDLRPGDALNVDEPGRQHIALFVEWAGSNVVHVIEESGWGTPAHHSWWNVWRSGNTLVGWAAYHPIRSVNVQEDCQAHCENGSVLVGADCGRGDCSVYGARCESDILGARCVFFACPALGEVDACLPDGRTIVHCVNGVPTSSADCGQYAAYCSTQGSGVAHCTSVFCANPGQTPVPHDLCSLNPDVLHCDHTGQFTATACPAGTLCTMERGPRCVAATGCPATPVDREAGACHGGVALRCYNGNAFVAVDCIAQGETCAVNGGKAECVPRYAGNPDAGTPTDGGSPPSDGGASPDAGTTADAGNDVDAGLFEDGGTEADAGEVADPDAGRGDDDPAEPIEPFAGTGGCRCSGFSPAAFALVAMALVPRRRHSARSQR